MNILPGEPAPPGFEGEIDRIAYIQTKLDDFKANALLGVEYILELQNEGQREPSYTCLLCDKRLIDARTVMQHLPSYNHRMEYLEKHFPTLAKEIKNFKYRPNPHQKVVLVLQRVAEAIEGHHGRLKPSVCNVDDFRRLKNKIVNDVMSKFHYDERDGPSFLEIVNRETLQITIKTGSKRGNDQNPDNYKRDLDEISSEDDMNENSKKAKKHDGSPYHRNLPRVRRSPPFEEQRFGDDRESLSGNQKELSSSWEQYRNQLEKHIDQMDIQQKEYEKNPEKHPLYNDEWIKFWNKRYKELQAEKKVNPNKYDYKPEWIEYWARRMKTLYDDEIKAKKKELKKKYNIAEDSEDRSFRSNNRGNGKQGNRSDTADVINISDDEDNDNYSRRKRRTSRTRSRSRSLSRSPLSRRSYPDNDRSRESDLYLKKYIKIDARGESPLPEVYDRIRRNAHFQSSRNYAPSRDRDMYMENSGPYQRFVTGSERSNSSGPGSGSYRRSSHYRVMDSHNIPTYERSPSPIRSRMDEELEDDEPLTVVAVLRLLTALESDLGSSGPKVVDLLTKALALEKIKANSSEELLLNEDTCVFFETLKEKLKGLIIAEVIDDPHKVKVVKKTVKNIAKIIHLVNTKGSEKKQSINDNFMNQNDFVNQNRSSSLFAMSKDLPFDRQLIATKMAAALVNAGRDDISTDEMDKLIYFFILMVKMAKEQRMRSPGMNPLNIRDIFYELGLQTNYNEKTCDMLNKMNNSSNKSNNLNNFHHDDDLLSLEKGEAKDGRDDPGSSNLESLTDSDLQTLLQNFKFLSREEQQHLIAHLRKLETADPNRVEKLRKFVNLNAEPGGNTSNNANDSPRSFNNDHNNRSKIINYNLDDDDDDENEKRSNDHNGPYERRSQKNKFNLNDDDDDDDYNFDEVFKAASRRVTNEMRSKEENNARHESVVPVSSSPTALTFNRSGFSSVNVSLNDTQNLIANLMGNLQHNNAMSNSENKNQRNNPAGNSNDLRQIPLVNNQKSRANASSMQGNTNNHNHQQQQQQMQQQPPHHPQMGNFNAQMNGPPNMEPSYHYQGPPGNNYDNYNQMMPNSQPMYYNNNNHNNNNNNGNMGGGYDQANGYPNQWNQGQPMPYNQMPYNAMGGYGPGYTGN